MNETNDEWVEHVYTELKKVDTKNYDADEYFNDIVLNLINRNEEKIKNFRFDNNFHDSLFSGTTILHFSIQYKSLVVVQRLMDIGAKTDIKNRQGVTGSELAQNFLDTSRTHFPDEHEIYRDISEALVSKL